MDGIMKKLSVFLVTLVLVLLCGCTGNSSNYDIVATTLPVYDFTAAICDGSDLHIGRLVTENVSCLHDYTLQVSQMRMIESADWVVISGAGLESFLDDALSGSSAIIDASVNSHIHNAEEHHDQHEHDDHGHSHDKDPHIWLSTENAKIMAQNIFDQLCIAYPQHKDIFQHNLGLLLHSLDELQQYGETQLKNLRARELITFHDGFAYFAEGFQLTILEAVEEESGSEASAAEIIRLIDLVHTNQLPAIFTEVSGSDACAGIIAAETGVQIFTLDMAMSGNSYFDAMYHNINTVKEALG